MCESRPLGDAGTLGTASECGKTALIRKERKKGEKEKTQGLGKHKDGSQNESPS